MGLGGLSGLSGLSSLFGSEHIEKVLGHSPISLWPLYEASGTTAACLVNAAQNGTYSSDVSTWPVGTGIGDGNGAPTFDGDDYVNIYTTTFRDAFDGDTGSISFWTFPSDWADAVTKYKLAVVVDGNNWFDIRKNGTNTIRFTAKCNGAFGAYIYSVPAGERSAFLHCCMTWAWGGVNTEVKCYAQADLKNTFNIAGQFAGVLSATQTVIGAASTVPASPFEGRQALVSVFDTPLVQAIVTDLAAV